MKLATFACLAAVALILGGCKEPYALTDLEKSVTQNGARDFADRSNMKYLGCSGQDSYPQDGYVSCTIHDPESKDNLTLQCSYKTQGCLPGTRKVN